MRAKLVSLDWPGLEELALAGGIAVWGGDTSGIAQLNFNDAKLKS